MVTRHLQTPWWGRMSLPRWPQWCRRRSGARTQTDPRSWWEGSTWSWRRRSRRPWSSTAWRWSWSTCQGGGHRTHRRVSGGQWGPWCRERRQCCQTGRMENIGRDDSPDTWTHILCEETCELRDCSYIASSRNLRCACLYVLKFDVNIRTVLKFLEVGDCMLRIWDLRWPVRWRRGWWGGTSAWRGPRPGWWRCWPTPPPRRWWWRILLQSMMLFHWRDCSYIISIHSLSLHPFISSSNRWEDMICEQSLNNNWVPSSELGLLWLILMSLLFTTVFTPQTWCLHPCHDSQDI